MAHKVKKHSDYRFVCNNPSDRDDCSGCCSECSIFCVGLGLLRLSDEVLTIFAGCSMPHICGLVYCVIQSVFLAKK